MNFNPGWLILLHSRQILSADPPLASLAHYQSPLVRSSMPLLLLVPFLLFLRFTFQDFQGRACVRVCVFSPLSPLLASLL